MKPADKLSKIYKGLFLLILFAGLVLRFDQYLINRSLWHDEAHLALNFVDLGFKDLAKPLENFQSAPIFFLWGVELFTHIFGLGEMSLRLLPFIFSIAVMPMFYYIVYELTKQRLTALIAFLIYALNISFVYYASELKPYTIDVSAYIVLSYLVLSSNRFVDRNRNILLILSGCALAFFSNSTQLVVVCIGTYYLQNLKIIKDETRLLAMPLKNLVVLGFWLLAIGVNYFIFVHDHPYASGMKEIWAWTFCPTPFFGPEFNNYMTTYFPNVFLQDLFLVDSTYFMGYIILALFIAGIIIAIVKKNYNILIFGLLPVTLSYVLSLFSLYPFYGRFILYAFPGIIMLMSIGISAFVLAINNSIYKYGAGLLAAIFLFALLKNSVVAVPKWEIKIKPALMYIDKNFPHTNVFVTTPYSMCEYYKKIGVIHCGDITRLTWHLDAYALLNDTTIQKQKVPYVILHSVTGGDNAEVFIPELKAKGLVISEYKANNFGVTEIRPDTSR